MSAERVVLFKSGAEVEPVAGMLVRYGANESLVFQITRIVDGVIYSNDSLQLCNRDGTWNRGLWSILSPLPPSMRLADLDVAFWKSLLPTSPLPDTGAKEMLEGQIWATYVPVEHSGEAVIWRVVEMIGKDPIGTCLAGGKADIPSYSHGTWAKHSVLLFDAISTNQGPPHQIGVPQTEAAPRWQTGELRCDNDCREFRVIGPLKIPHIWDVTYYDDGELITGTRDDREPSTLLGTFLDGQIEWKVGQQVEHSSHGTIHIVTKVTLSEVFFGGSDYGWDIIEANKHILSGTWLMLPKTTHTCKGRPCGERFSQDKERDGWVSLVIRAKATKVVRTFCSPACRDAWKPEAKAASQPTTSLNISEATNQLSSSTSAVTKPTTTRWGIKYDSVWED